MKEERIAYPQADRRSYAPTLYSIIGDLVDWLATIGLVVVIVVALVRERRARQGEAASV